MAATANSSLPTLSPRSSLRGPESDPAGAPSPATVDATAGEMSISTVESSDNSAGAGNAGNKKPAWNKPSNGAVVESGPVMGADTWPALSDSARASPKLTPSDSSFKTLSDFGSVTTSLQITGVSPLSSSPSSSLSPLPSQSQSSIVSQKPVTNSANDNPTPNHWRPTRQKSFKRDGGSIANANGGFSHQSSPPGEGSNSHSNSYMKPGSFSGGGSETSGRDYNAQNHGNRESGSRNAGGDHHQPRNSFRRGNGGPHSRGDGSHQNYGGRRGDQDRGNHDWNHQRSFNGRDAPPLQPRIVPRGYMRTPPPVSGPFVHPAPMRPFVNPMGMPEMSMFYIPPGVPLVAPVPAPMYFPVPDPQLHAKIVNQIDYYFSNENLIKDTYLRQNMDEHGWVPITLIASFKKVVLLTNNIQLILDAVRSSAVVEVQGDKIRKRDDWMRWIMPPTVQLPIRSGSQSQSQSPSSVGSLSAHIQNVTLDENWKSMDVNSSKGQIDAIAPTIVSSSSGDSTTKDGATSSGCC